MEFSPDGGLKKAIIKRCKLRTCNEEERYLTAFARIESMEKQVLTPPQTANFGEDNLSSTSRRRWLGLFAIGIGARLHPALAATMATPRQSAGPFYPAVPPPEVDNDLTRMMGSERIAVGDPTELTGTVRDRANRPVAGARVEIWQCDSNGRYRHPAENGPRPVDPGFQGFGHTRTDGEGHYRFRTIKPVRYPGRTPHIHFAVFVGEERPFVTQMYVAGAPENETDFLYQRLNAKEQEAVTVDFRRPSSDSAGFSAHFPIVLGDIDGTPQLG
jgi:protocatechuate 3,4-dioxygenase beta subunit